MGNIPFVVGKVSTDHNEAFNVCVVPFVYRHLGYDGFYNLYFAGKQPVNRIRKIGRIANAAPQYVLATLKD